MFRGVDMSSVVLAAGGFAAADFGVTWSLGTCTAQRNATESFVYGAPSGGLFVPSQNAGYLVPATVAPAGYGAFTLAIVGTQVHVQTSAPVLPGVMVSFAIRGNLYVFGGATRLIP